MNSPRSQFPLWLFIATDLALIGAAAVIAAQAPQPFSQATILWIVTCIVLGVIVGLVPIIWHFERKKNEALDDRQRALEALARTVNASAEQISIATGGLHEIAEAAQKNLRQADQLPHRLQEKIAEFQAQLAQANDTEKEELERELLALRTSETERLETVSQRIAKTSAEWVKLEAATAQQLATVTLELTRLAQGTSAGMSQAHAAAEQTLAQARVETARGLSEVGAQAVKAIEAARHAALDDLGNHLAGLLAQVAHDAATQLSARLASSTADLETQLARLEANRAALALAASTPPAATPRAEISAPAPAPALATAAAGEASAVASTEAVNATNAAESPAPTAATGSESARVTPGIPGDALPATPVVKRPRKPRREEVAVASAGATEPLNGAAKEPVATTSGADPASEPAISPAPAPAAPNEANSAASPVGGTVATLAAVESSDSAPVNTTVAHEAPPPSTPAPSPARIAPALSAEPANPPPPVGSAAPADATPEPDALKAALPRKRAAKTSPADEAPALDLGLDDGDFGDAARNRARGVMERVLTSDGATRLIVTAYIGIGNRLFIRGEGPGLSWERGVPLEFVSIGKWRWQTNDASQPIQFKIYKNDELECPTLGKQVVDPGYQQEVTAGF